MQIAGRVGVSAGIVLFAVAQRMIMQAPGMPQPIEMSTEMDRRGRRPTQQAAEVREKAERVGSESITTPAGTFQCEHL